MNADAILGSFYKGLDGCEADRGRVTAVTYR